MAKRIRVLLFSLATSARFERLVRAVPGGEGRAWRRARRYVAGSTLDQARAVVEDLARAGRASSVDFFGELVGDEREARRVCGLYEELASGLSAFPEGTWLSLDPSHLGLDVSPALFREHLERVCARLPAGRLVQVGAEDSSRTEATLRVVHEVAAAGGPVMATVQANLRRGRDDAVRLAEAGVPVRLVKGAYVEPSDRAWPWGADTDRAYADVALRLHGMGARFALATHDGALRDRIVAATGARPDCEMLLGVRPGDIDALLAAGHAVRLYVPYGEGWFRYFMRRLAESLGA